MITYYRDENNIPYALLPHQNIQGVTLTPIGADEYQSLLTVQTQRRQEDEMEHQRRFERAQREHDRRQKKWLAVSKSAQEKLIALGFTEDEVKLFITLPA